MKPGPTPDAPVRINPCLPIRDSYTVLEVAEALNRTCGVAISCAKASIFRMIESGHIKAYRWMPNAVRGHGAAIRYYIPRNQLPGIYEGWKV